MWACCRDAPSLVGETGQSVGNFNMGQHMSQVRDSEPRNLCGPEASAACSTRQAKTGEVAML